MIGYTRAHRDRFNHPLFATQKFCRGYAWDWMVARAAFKPHDIEIKGQTITLNRGQFSHSMRYMTKAFGWSLGVTQRFIDRLKTEHMIDTATNHGQIIVTICKYDIYQAEQTPDKDASDTPNDTAAIQDRYSSDTNKKEGYNKGKEGKVLLPAKAAPKKRATRLPDDWFLPASWGEWAVKEGYGLDGIYLEAEKFKDYWIGVGGQKGTKLNWEATWRNWIRNSKQMNGKTNGKQSYNERAAAKDTARIVDEGADATRIAIARRLSRSQA